MNDSFGAYQRGPSYYSMDVDPRGFQTHGSYWSVGGAAPNESAVAPDSSMIAYTAGYGAYVPPGRGQAYKSMAATPGEAAAMQSYAGYGRFPGTAVGAGFGTGPLMALAALAVLAGVLSDK